jgi:hypothetical protein
MVNFMLVAGARLGAWAWGDVLPYLRATGHGVYPLTLSGAEQVADEVVFMYLHSPRITNRWPPPLTQVTTTRCCRTPKNGLVHETLPVLPESLTQVLQSVPSPAVAVVVVHLLLTSALNGLAARTRYAARRSWTSI